MLNKIKVLGELFPSEAPEENLFLTFFHPLEAALIPWLVVSSSVFKALSITYSNLSLLPWQHCLLSVSDSSCLPQEPLGLYWVYLDNPELFTHLNILNLITSIK